MTDRSPLCLPRLAFFGGLAIAFVLAGCGIKGPLEAPPRAELADSDSKLGKEKVKETSQEKKAAQSRSLSAEKSKVQRAPQQSIMPPSSPEEWKKKKEDSQSQSSKQLGTHEKPNKPFFLDWLL